MKKCANCGAEALDSMKVCLECGTLFEEESENNKANGTSGVETHQDEGPIDFDQLEFVEAKVLAPEKDDKRSSRKVRKLRKTPEVPTLPTLPTESMDEFEAEAESEGAESSAIEAEVEPKNPTETESTSTDSAPAEVASKPITPSITPTDSVHLMREVFNPEPHYIAPDTFGPSEKASNDEILADILSTVNCPHCGNENPSYYSFCHFCKHRLRDYTDEEQSNNTPIDSEAVREEAVLAAKSSSAPLPRVQPEANPEPDDFVLSHHEVEPPLITQKKSTESVESSPPKKFNFFKWIVRLLIIAILIALAGLAFLYFQSTNSAETVYKNYRQAMISENYTKAAELTANNTGPAWQASDIERMLLNYSQADIDLLTLLNDQQEGTVLASGSTPLIEIKTEPSFLGLMNQYEVVVQPIKLALTVPNDYRDIKLTTFAHEDQPITAGDPIIVEPRETEIIVSLHDGSEQRYIALDLDYNLLEEGTLPISLKQVNNQIQIDTASSGIQYPNQFKPTGFVIDGETYDSNSVTLNGYVSQSFTVAVIAEYFGEEVQSEAVEIRLVDAEEVLVDLSNDAVLPDALAKIEKDNADNIQPSQDSDQFNQWVQEFQETFIDAVNFRAPDLLAVYGDTSQWYQDTTQWIQNEIATTSIFYSDATYEITSIEESDDGNVAIFTLERYYYTLDGIEAIRSLNKVYRLQSIDGQYVIVSVDEQDTSN